MTDGPTSQLSSDEVERLYIQHAEAIRRYLKGIVGNDQDAEDCVQSTFAILQQKGGLCAEGARRAWLFRVGYNEAMQLFRRQKTSKTDEGTEVIGEFESTLESPEDKLIHGERVEQLREALSQLPTEQQQVVDLRVTEGLRFREIAERLDIPLGTALARMQTALKRLSTKLDDE